MQKFSKTSIVDLTSNWLYQRFHFDAKARHKTLEQEFLRRLTNQSASALRLLDLGSGTAANFLYLSMQIPAKQHWILVESNQQLLEDVPKNLELLAQFFGSELATDWFARLQSGEISYELRCQDFFKDSLLLFREGFDAITANAVFDLNSSEQFRDLLQSIKQTRSLQAQLYFTLHLNSELSFLPEHPDDSFIGQSYHDHMSRPQDFGQAMGASAAEQMQQELLAERYKVQTGSSPWHISAQDQVFFEQNLHFMQTALMTDEMSEDDITKCGEWFAYRKSCRGQVDSPSTIMNVGHLDILAAVSD
ncbi:MAG: class I SAM-dependent methyltransferase [Oligoflexus sp.]